MSMAVWGPLGWDWLHNLAICYPRRPTENDQHFHYLKIKKFIESLPCIKCRQHAIYYIKNINPIDLLSNQRFQFWVFHFHNHVNALKNKKIFSLNDYNKKYRTHLH